jgi:hypothetical protein
MSPSPAGGPPQDPVATRPEPQPVNVEAVMKEIEERVRQDLRQRLARGGGPPEYQDEQLFAQVERILRRAIRDRDHDATLLKGLLGDPEDWQLRTAIRFSSHRPRFGRVIVALKRRLLLPLVRWLYEFELENVARQQRLNRLLFACIEELAIDNARLREEVRERGARLPSPP